jgi:hypothetical protein
MIFWKCKALIGQYNSNIFELYGAHNRIRFWLPSNKKTALNKAPYSTYKLPMACNWSLWEFLNPFYTTTATAAVVLFTFPTYLPQLVNFFDIFSCMADIEWM